MAKRPKPGHCIHCGGLFDELTWDHVFPVAWYPASTPPNLEKWKVPSCPRCNAEYGALEKDLLLRMGLCLGPEDYEAAGISEKALRAIKPEFAKTDKDRRARHKAGEAVKAELEWTEDLDSSRLLPGFGPRPYFKYSEYAGVRISADALRKLGIKIVKGMTYILRSKIIPADYEISVTFPGGPDPAPVARLFDSGRTEYRGPGLMVIHASATDDPLVALYKIMVWGRLVMNAVVLRVEEQNAAERAV